MRKSQQLALLLAFIALTLCVLAIVWQMGHEDKNQRQKLRSMDDYFTNLYTQTNLHRPAR